MCTSNIYTWVYPDGRTEQIYQPSLCSASVNGQPCMNNVVFQHPSQFVPYNESTLPYMTQLPPTPQYSPASSPPIYRPGDESDHSYGSNSSKKKKPSSGIHVNGTKVLDLNRRESHRRERIVLVDNTPTPRTPPSPNANIYAQTSPRRRHSVILYEHSLQSADDVEESRRRRQERREQRQQRQQLEQRQQHEHREQLEQREQRGRREHREERAEREGERDPERRERREECEEQEIHQIQWSPSQEIRGIRCYEVLGTIDGVPVNALPDSGSAVEAMSETFAKQHNLKIEATDTQLIRLLGGHLAESVGRVVADFKFQGESDVHPLEFHVLRKSVYDLVLGKKFLDQTRTLTTCCRRIVERIRPCFQKGSRLFLLDESPKDHVRCTVNGAEALAFPDTGSDEMIVSGSFVRRNKLRVHREEKYRTTMQLINGSTIRTDGMVLNAEFQFDAPPMPSQELNYHRYLKFATHLSSLTGQSKGMPAKTVFKCDLHVVEDLPCDIILSNEFIFQNQIFSRFKSLFCSRSASRLQSEVAPNDGILFVRRTASSWLSRWRQPPPKETNTVPLQGGASWEERWEFEEDRRNRTQVHIASLPDSQKLDAQRVENDRQAVWDRNNPRQAPTTPISTGNR